MKLRLLPGKEFEKIYSKVPRIAVELIISSKRGVVLVKRGRGDAGPGKGTWHLPGKTLMFGETIRHLAMRTAEDETGLNVRIKKFIGYHEYRPGVAYGHVVSLVFLAEAAGGTLHDKQGRKIRFFKKLPKNIGFGHRKILLNAGFR